MGVQDGGFVKCWGYNKYGQLGYGDTTQRGDGGNEMGASIPSRMILIINANAKPRGCHVPRCQTLTGDYCYRSTIVIVQVFRTYATGVSCVPPPLVQM